MNKFFLAALIVGLILVSGCISGSYSSNPEDLNDDSGAGYQNPYSEQQVSRQKIEEEEIYSPEEEREYCTSGWKCYTPAYEGYQYSDCSWESKIYCSDGCEDGECKIVQVCSPNTEECYGAYIKKCSSDGTYWNYYHEYCSYGCESGQCKQKPQICMPNTEECNGNYVKKCSFDGTFWDYYSEYCLYGCENGVCKPEPVECYMDSDCITPKVCENNSCVSPTIEIVIPLTPINDTEEEAYSATYIVDGDTFDLNTGDRIRLICIDTPETYENHYQKAKDRLKELILNKKVTLEKDVSETDRYGRLLRYIYVGNTFVNEILVKEGLAEVYRYPPDTKHCDLFEEAEDYAKANGLGIWTEEETQEEEPSYESNVMIYYINYDAEGNDNYNLNGEYVIVWNYGSNTIDISGWTLRDEKNHIYTLPSLALSPGAYVYIFSGCGTNSGNYLYWCHSYAIWNNNGDTGYLRTSGGNLVNSYSY